MRRHRCIKKSTVESNAVWGIECAFGFATFSSTLKVENSRACSTSIISSEGIPVQKIPVETNAVWDIECAVGLTTLGSTMKVENSIACSVF